MAETKLRRRISFPFPERGGVQSKGCGGFWLTQEGLKNRDTVWHLPKQCRRRSYWCSTSNRKTDGKNRNLT